jgi:hypothetical protein
MEMPNSKRPRGENILGLLGADGPMEHWTYLGDCGFYVMKTLTYYWTTAYVGNGKSLSNPFFILCAKRGLSLTRFQTAPSILEGDVLSVYAAKRGAD